MAGIYVAKPAEIIVAEIPPYWNPIWEFPGATPPGYTPIYGLWLTASAYTVKVGDSITISSTLMDCGTYKTTTPTNTAVTWDSTIGYTGGATASLAVNDNGFYADSGIFSFTEEGTAVITISGDPFGSGTALTHTINIVVEKEEEEIITKAVVTITCNGSGESCTAYMSAIGSTSEYTTEELYTLYCDGAGWLYECDNYYEAGFSLSDPELNAVYSNGDYTTDINATTATININSFTTGRIYTFFINAVYGVGGVANVTYNVKFYSAEDQLVRECTNTSEMTYPFTTPVFLVFNVDTQVITES